MIMEGVQLQGGLEQGEMASSEAVATEPRLFVGQVSQLYSNIATIS